MTTEQENVLTVHAGNYVEAIDALREAEARLRDALLRRDEAVAKLRTSRRQLASTMRGLALPGERAPDGCPFAADEINVLWSFGAGEGSRMGSES